MTGIRWELYQTFLAALKGGSLSAAARHLGITQPTVGRQLSALERYLGCRLFTRTPTGLLPTPQALALEGQAQAMAASAAALVRTASLETERIGGTVRVSVSEVIGIEVMPPILADLTRAHPRLKVELVLTNRLQNLLRREADLAVRMAVPQQQRLIARRVGSIEIGLHAHPAYLARCGTPSSVSELQGHCLIGFDAETEFIREALKTLGGLKRSWFTLATDSDVTQLALIRAAAGIGVCQVPLAQRTPALQRVLPKAVHYELETYVTMHEDLRPVPACRRVFEALVAGLERHLAR